jgi:hypothetical protein
MQKSLKKPSFGKLYVLKFPRFYTTWRLKEVKDGCFIFVTSCGNVTDKMNILRFNFLYNRFCVDELDCPEIAKPQNTKIKITIEKKTAFISKEHTKEELNSLIDDIEDIEF